MGSCGQDVGRDASAICSPRSIAARRIWAAISGSAMGVLLGGCTPTLGLGPPAWQAIPNHDNQYQAGDKKSDPFKGPAVQVLINHVTCQLARDYDDHKGDADKLWPKLAQYNFV